MWCLIRKISSHGYQNYLAPPTSEPSRDRYIQPSKIKPTPPCSPNNALPAHTSIMAIEADFPIRKLLDFLQIFTFQKDERNHGRGRSIFWKKKFQKCAGTWLLFLKSEKGHIGVLPHHQTSMGTKGEGRVGGGRVWRSVEVNLGGGRVRGRVGAICFLFSPATCLFWVFPSQFPNKGKNAQIQKRDQRRNIWPHFNTSCVRPQGRRT